MWFWWFMLICDIFIPLLIIVIGGILYKYPPKKINSLIGYRTTLSMSNEEAWNFSQKYSSKILFITGLIMLVPSILVHIPFYGKDEDTISILSVIVLCVQLITIIACIIPVEIKLRKKFKDR